MMQQFCQGMVEGYMTQEDPNGYYRMCNKKG